MFWIRSGLHSISISDWLTAGPAVVPDASAALEDARDAMLEALGDAGRRKRATLGLRIQTAQDAASLWALRPDVMTVACQIYGESDARKRLAVATASFQGLVPEAAVSRKGRPATAGAAR
jgi:hypothetical protein